VAEELRARRARGSAPPLSQLAEQPVEPSALQRGRAVSIEVKVPGSARVLRPRLRLPGSDVLRDCELCSVQLGANVSLGWEE
jgi:hypothetical protein